MLKYNNSNTAINFSKLYLGKAALVIIEILTIITQMKKLKMNYNIKFKLIIEAI